MRGLIRQSVRRPVAVSMLYVAVGFLAVGAWVDLPVQLEIEGRPPSLTISSSWGTASPESVQALVTSPIEALAVTIPGITKMRSTSGRGSSSVVLELAEDADVDLVRFELSDRLALLREDLPPGVNPVVRAPLPEDLAQYQQDAMILEYQLQSPRSLSALRAWAIDNLQTPLSAVDGVGTVAVHGGDDPHLRVSLDPELCELYGVDPGEVEAALAELDETEPLGQVEIGRTAYAVRVEQAVDRLDTLRSLPLRRTGENIIRLSDVGTVRLAYEQAEVYTRIDGRFVVTVQVERRSGTDVLSVANGVKARMQELQRTFPPDIRAELITDIADELQAEFRLLGRRLIVILVIVAALLLLMLQDLRTPLFLFGSLAAAVSLAIIALYHLEIPVNLLTITGLALAFGMLVDNGVVVLENIVRYREKGVGAKEAAERGTAEVVVPVLAATATTIAVFGPFIIFQGRLRDYYLPLALAVALSLAASLFVAVTLMPAAAGKGWVVRAPRIGREPGPRYRKGLAWGLRHPWIVLALVAGIGWYTWELFNENVPRGGFWSSFGRDRLYVSLSLPPGAEAATADQQMRRFEEYVLGLPDIERVTMTVNNSNEIPGQGPYSRLTVLFDPEVETTAYPLMVKDELIGMATAFAGVRISVSGFDTDGYYSGGWGFGARMNSRISLYGYNYEQLGRFGEEIAATARRHPRVQETQVTSGGRSARTDAVELVMSVRRDVMESRGIRVDQVVWQVQRLLQGRDSPDTLRIGREEWELRLKMDGVDRRTVDEVLETPVAAAAAGSGLLLRDVLETEFRTIPGQISREDQRYHRTVEWEYRGSSRARQAYLEAIFESIELPPGYAARIEQSSFLTREEERQIRSVAIAALVLIFMILASLYESLIQPFIVLLSVPCALIGVFLIFYFTEKPFDPSAQIGVVLLGGIVVNNAIILVDHINLRRRDGLELAEAVITGAAERVRPILITSITTIGGLLPLVVLQGDEAGSGGSSQDLWSNLALATIGGLAAATILTLTVIPVLYLQAERLRAGGHRLMRHLGRIWRSLPGATAT